MVGEPADAAELVASLASREHTVVTRWVDEGGGSADLIDDVLAGLAEIARRLWPRWYGSARQPETAGSTPDALRGAAADQPGVSPAWLEAAWNRAAGGRAPARGAHARAVHAAQLAKALDSRGLWLLLALGRDPGDSRLLGVARAAEWLARQTESRVAVIAALPLTDRPQLDPIAYDALHLDGAEGAAGAIYTDERAQPERERAAGSSRPDAGPSAPVVIRADERQHNSAERAPARAARPAVQPAPPEAELPRTAERALAERAPGLDIRPIVGQPHPLSPAEQLLAAAIRQAPDLRTVFEYNMPIQTRGGERFVVDLLWRDGLVAVEVDSYRYHGGRRAFRRDRRRDAELLQCGYRVMRLVHDDIVADVQAALESLRGVVKLVREEMKDV